MVRNLPRVRGFGVGRESRFNHVSQKAVSGIRDSSWALNFSMNNHYTYFPPKVLSLIRKCYLFLWCCTCYGVIYRFPYILWGCLQIHCLSLDIIKTSFMCDSGGMQLLVHAVTSVQFNSNAIAVNTCTPFRRRHFQMNFLEWKCMNTDWNFTEVCSSGSN